MATAELQDDDHDAFLPANERKRMRLIAFFGIVACLCICAGIGLGVGLARIGPDDEDDSSRDSSGDGTTTPATPFDSMAPRRMYYYLQWGAISAGCRPPKDAPLHLTCQRGGTLGIMEIALGVSCSEEIHAGRTMTVCRLDPELERAYTNGPDDLGREYQDLILANLTLASQEIVAYCEGTVDDGSLILDAHVNFNEEIAEEEKRNLLPEERLGYCDHLWWTVPSAEDNSTEKRAYGGGSEAFLSTSVLCAATEEEFDIALEDITCATGEGVLVGELSSILGNESVPICTHVDSCIVDVDNCPIEETDEDPCGSTHCIIALDKNVRTAAPSQTEIRFCSVTTDSAKLELMNGEIIASAVEPYALTVLDISNFLAPMRAQVLGKYVQA